MPIVDLGDGREIDIPDDAPPEVLNQVRQKLQGMGFMAKAQEVPKPAGFLESTARDLMSGFGKAAAVPVRGAAMLADAFLPTKEVGTTLRDAADSAEQYWTGVGDKSTNNAWGQAALRGVGGAATTGPATVVNVAAGAGSGIGEEVAKRLDPNNNNPLLRVVGSVVGGFGAGTVAGLATRARPQAADVARETMEGITPQQLEAAQAYKNQLAARGLDVDLAQALQATSGHSGNLASVRDFLAGRRQGDQVQSILRNQPEQLAREAEMTVGGLPGTNFSAKQNANNVQQAATTVLQNAKEARSALWSQTVQDGVAALKASEGVKVAAAEEFAKQAGITLGQARSKVSQLVQDLANSKQADAADIASLNQRVSDIQGLVQGLREFSLPRGQTSTNAGSLVSLPQRGQSIVNDSASREGRASFLESTVPVPVAPAPSLTTLQKQNALGQAQLDADLRGQLYQDALGKVQVAREGFKATETVPQPVLTAVHNKLEALIQQFPGAVEGTELAGLKANLTTPNGPLTNPDQINRVLTQFTTRLKSPDLKTAGMDAGTSKYLGGVVDSLRSDLGQGFAPIRQANEAYKNFTDSVYAPLKQGPVGELAQRGYSNDTQAMVSKFDSLMNRGTDPTARVSDIRTAAKELSSVDKEVFADAFKGWLSRKVQSTIEASGSGNVLPTADPAALRDALFKDPLQWQGIKDATAEMAKVRGQSPQEVIRGLENLRQLTTAMANRPSSIGGVSPSDLKQLGSASNVANLVRVASFLPVNRVGEAIERATLGKTLSQLDTILTSPEGAKMLIELGKVPVMSRKAQVILGTWGGGVGNSPGLSDYNPPE